MISHIITSIGAGIVYGLLGYAKSEEKFDTKKFSRALILGALAGGYAAYAGVSWNEAYTFLASAGWVALVDFTLKLIWKKVKK